MASQRGTFLKRQRETDLKDKAKQKQARRAEKRAQPDGVNKGPSIDWEAAVTETDSALESPAGTPGASTDNAEPAAPGAPESSPPRGASPGPQGPGPGPSPGQGSGTGPQSS